MIDNPNKKKKMQAKRRPLPQNIRNARQPLWFELAFAGLAAILILNLNGVVSVIWDINQVFSLMVLGLCGVVIYRLQKYTTPSLASSGKLIITFFVVYIAWGGFIGLIFGKLGAERVTAEAVSFLSSMMVIISFALIGYFVRKTTNERRLYFLMFFLFLIATSSGFIGIIFPKWNEIYITKVTDIGRATGFFANPNELGIQAGFLMAFGALLTFSRGSMWWFIVGLIVAMPVALLSQSKTAVLLCLCIGGLLLLSLMRQGLLGKNMVVALVVVGVIIGPLVLIGSGGSSSKMEMTTEQTRRSGQLKKLIFEGKIDAETTTGRTEAAKEGVVMFLDSPILGNGLSALNRMPKIGLGCHNTVIKIAGDGGILIFLLFVFAGMSFFYDIKATKNSNQRACYIACLLTLTAACLSTHNFLDDRNHNAILGLLIGLTAMNKRDENSRHLRRQARLR